MLHIFNRLQDVVYPGSSRHNAHTVCPAEFEVPDSSPVPLADIKQPVEDVIIVFGIYNKVVCGVENGGCFGVYEAADAQERSVCRGGSSSFGVVHETFLT